jgi:hypothetical protein
MKVADFTVGEPVVIAVAIGLWRPAVVTRIEDGRLVVSFTDRTGTTREKQCPARNVKKAAVR